MWGMEKDSAAGELNVRNRTLFTDRRGFFAPSGNERRKKDLAKVADNLAFLRGMNSACVDLVYAEPPANSRHRHEAPMGGAGWRVFYDVWRSRLVRPEWARALAVRFPAAAKLLDLAAHPADRLYLIYMAIRLREIGRVLKPGGGIYLHCDSADSHWWRLMLDAVFGADNFRSHIVWEHDSPARVKNNFAKRHDILLRYAKGGDETFHPAAVAPPPDPLTGRKNPPEDVWAIPAVKVKSAESVGFLAQKPLALLEKIILASSSEGDVVLDPFCGCATACVAAEKLGRRWIGMDASPSAFDILAKRLAKDLRLSVTVCRQRDEQKILRIKKINDSGAVLAEWEAYHRIMPPQRDGDVLLDIKGGDKAEVCARLFQIQKGFCNGCGNSFPAGELNLDRLVPKLFGGLDFPTNFQLLCATCVRIKGKRTMEEFSATRRKAGAPPRDIPESEHWEKEQWDLERERRDGAAAT